MLRVLLSPIKDSFVRLPPRVAHELLGRGSSRVVLRMETDDWQTGRASSVLVSWDGSVSGGEEVEVSSNFWGALRADSLVRLELVDTPPDCGIVCVEPLTCDDWEVLELNAGYLEEQILSQTFVLSLGQIFPLWIYGKQMVSLVVKSLDCGASGVMRPCTSFVVEPKPRKLKRAACTSMKPVTLRVLPATGDERPGFVLAGCEDWTDGVIACISNPHPPLWKQEEAVSQVVLRVLRDASVKRGCVRMAADAMLALQVLPWALVQVFPNLQGPIGGMKKCQLVVWSHKKVEVDPLWRLFVDQNAARVFSHGTLVQFPNRPPLFAQLLFEGADGGFILGEQLKHVGPSFSFEAPYFSVDSVRVLSPSLAMLVGVEAAAWQLASHLFFFLREPLCRGNLAVVSGGIGSGKSALIRSVCGSVPELYTEIVECERLVGEKMSAVRRALTDAVLRCQGNFPSCLVFENLHLLCPESDEASFRPQQLAEAALAEGRNSGKPLLAEDAFDQLEVKFLELSKGQR